MAQSSNQLTTGTTSILFTNVRNRSNFNRIFRPSNLYVVFVDFSTNMKNYSVKKVLHMKKIMPKSTICKYPVVNSIRDSKCLSSRSCIESSFPGTWEVCFRTFVWRDFSKNPEDVFLFVKLIFNVNWSS